MGGYVLINIFVGKVQHGGKAEGLTCPESVSCSATPERRKTKLGRGGGCGDKIN